MNKLLNLASLIIVSAAPIPAFAQSSGSVCADLQGQWDLIEQNLAAKFADSVSDNSAPRETNRGIDELNYNVRATLLYDLMKDNDCPLPKKLPTGNDYMTAALKCRTEMIGSRGSQLPESCKRANWRRETN